MPQSESNSKPRSQAVSLGGLAETAGVAGCAATLTGFFGRHSWLLELTSHFRFQLAVALGLIALVCLGFRRRWSAVIMAGFALLNVGLVVEVASPRTSSGTQTSKPIRLMTLNVHTANTRFDMVLDSIRQADPDLVLLLEVNTRWMAELAPLRTNYATVVAEPREDNFGIALFTRLPVTQSEVLELGDAEVPSIAVEFITGTNHLQMLGTHPLPPGSAEYARARNVQLTAIAEWARQQTGSAVVLGDLNATPWSPYFRDLLRDGGLLNLQPGWGTFSTWPAQLPFLRIPLDHCLTTPGVGIVRKEVGSAVGGDHLPLIVDVAVFARDGK